MLTHARVLGYVFNPLTVFWCHDPAGAPVCVVAEVHNTYGERHRYLLRPGRAGPGRRPPRSSTSRRSSRSTATTGCACPSPATGSALADHACTATAAAPFVADAARAPPAGRPPARCCGPRCATRWSTAGGQRCGSAGRASACSCAACRSQPRPAAPRARTVRREHRRAARRMSTIAGVADATGRRTRAAGPTWPASRATRARARDRRRPAAPGRGAGCRCGSSCPTARTLGARPATAPADAAAPARRRSFRRLGAAGLIGFGESYLAGDWDADDLPRLLGRLRRARRGRWCRAGCSGCATSTWPGTRAPRRNTVDGARRNIHRHYDLSNDLFALFLDETMTYSSALFDTDAAGRPVATADRCSPTRSAARSTGCSTGAGVGPGTPAARDRHRLGRAGDPGRRSAARRVHTVTLSAEQRDAGAAPGRRRPGWPTGSTSSCATTARSTGRAATTRSSASR